MAENWWFLASDGGVRISFATAARHLKKPQNVLPTRKSPALRRAHPSPQPQKAPRVKPRTWRTKDKSTLARLPIKDTWKHVLVEMLRPKSKYFAFAFVMPNHSKRVRINSIFVLGLAVTGSLLTVWAVDTVVKRFWRIVEDDDGPDARTSEKI
ncbi:hypothetical protein BKA66DRAFT_609157 [Pyrenochaeta sp. MPI-SDFR-AT-0127]|nr:hypothetical protein BKA66DRAFT_609157 [Pyrenochaeta sp. MPI-SDFR-AT-0127]